jgi:methionyl-tRNA synthetase
VYWPAILLSAGLPLPTDILVHDYLTIDGRKISKSAGGGGAGVGPAALARRFGTDAVRWWLLREVPRVGDADFTVARLITRANDDLANGLGNLVSRVTSMAHRYRQGRPGTAGRDAVAAAGVPPDADARVLLAACLAVPGRVTAALAGHDFRAATNAVWDVVDLANRYVEQSEPWRLAAAERAGDLTAGPRLDAALGALIVACRTLAVELAPFIPDLAARVAAACDDSSGRLPEPRNLFPRVG